MEPALSICLRIRGRVQGVGYRQALCARALAAGLAGWVRNRADGSVEARVAGPAPAVRALLAWAHDGPPLARVAGIDIEALPVEAAVGPGFETRPTL